MVYLREGSFARHETLGGNGLEGEDHWVFFPHMGDCYVTPSHMA